MKTTSYVVYLLPRPFLTTKRMVGWTWSRPGHLSTSPGSRGRGASATVLSTTRRLPASRGSLSRPCRYPPCSQEVVKRQRNFAVVFTISAHLGVPRLPGVPLAGVAEEVLRGELEHAGVILRLGRHNPAQVWSSIICPSRCIGLSYFHMT